MGVDTSDWPGPTSGGPGGWVGGCGGVADEGEGQISGERLLCFSNDGLNEHPAAPMRYSPPDGVTFRSIKVKTLDLPASTSLLLRVHFLLAFILQICSNLFPPRRRRIKRILSSIFFLFIVRPFFFFFFAHPINCKSNGVFI